MNVDREDRISDTSSAAPSKLPILAIAAGVVVLALIAILFFGRNAEEPQQPIVKIDSTPPATPAQVAPEPAVAPPPATEAPPVIPESPATPPPPPLPALSESDDEVRATLGDVLPDALDASLKSDQLISRAAVVLSNFGLGKVIRDKLALPRPTGKFAVDERSVDSVFLSQSNYSRYDLAVDTLTDIDTSSAATWFRRYEPLFDMAYAELGESTQTARGSIKAGIRVLLDATYPEEPPALIQPAVFYKYADPALERQPDSVKVLIRMGPENRLRVLNWLQELNKKL